MATVSGTSTMPADEAGDGRAAQIDRRFYAFAVDRLIAWATDLAVAVVVARALLVRGHVLLGCLLVVATVLLVGLVFALLQGATGRTPGKLLTGLRLVDTDTERPIGARRAVLRSVVLGLAVIPFGVGLAALAWTAVADRSGLRRGWHDQLVSAIVVAAQPEPVVDPAPDERPRHVVNLTAMRLVPAPRQVAAIVPPSTPARALRPAVSRGWLPADRAAWGVSFDTGDRVVVDTLLLIGRSPDQQPGEQGARLVALPSGDLSVSRTHVAVVVAADGALVVTDRGSTNGSTLVRRGARRHLTPGRPTTLLEGDVVLLGDRAMRVERGRSDAA